jgi:hypothetical protein
LEIIAVTTISAMTAGNTIKPAILRFEFFMAIKIDTAM